MKNLISFLSMFSFFLLFSTEASANSVNGENVIFVKMTNSNNEFVGCFANRGNRNWVEEGTTLGRTRFTFKELNRDAWSVYLKDESRNISIQLDLHTKKVYYTGADGKRVELYNISKAYSKVDGRIATRVNMKTKEGPGYFKMLDNGNWVEGRVKPGYSGSTFTEMNRDDWSIYLRDASRGLYIQLDLHTRKVMISYDNNRTPAFLYNINAAQ